MSRSDQTRRTWRRPIQLAVLTLVGLLSALLGTGPWRWLAWVCLSVPLAATVRAWLVRDGR